MNKDIIIMYGPGYGHNIMPFLEFFNDNDSYKLIFVYRNNSEFQTKFTNVEFFRYSLKPKVILNFYRLLKCQAKLIWFHGGFNIFTLFVFLLFKQKKTKILLNIWGEYLPRILLKKNIKSSFYKNVLKHYDFIQCNWFNTYNLLKKTGLKNGLVKFWGLDDQIFREESWKSKNTGSFVTDFINQIPDNKIKFFYPKSFSKYSRHDLLIEAVYKIKQDKIENFIIYLWLGNENDKNIFSELSMKIINYNLQDNVKIIEHPFINQFEYWKIWSFMDCGLQIAEFDQISSTFTEPIALKKDIIATEIESYIIFKGIFEIKLELVPLTIEDLYFKIRKFIEGEKTPYNELINRSQKLETKYNFQKNLSQSLLFYINE